MNWIKTSERMPDMDVMVLFYVNRPGLQRYFLGTLKLVGEHPMWESDAKMHFPVSFATHWSTFEGVKE